MIAYKPLGSTTAARPLVRPFRGSDYVALHALVTEASGKPLVDDPAAAGRAYEAGGPAFTAEGFHDSRRVALGSAGFFIHWPGRANGWAILSPTMLRDRRLLVWFTRETTRRIPLLMVGHGVRRLEADVLPAGIAWAKRLGFELEVDMPLYGPDGETFFRFVRLRS
jgi:hypothetical protein